MAQIANITNTVFDSILPTFGTKAARIPVWNEGQKMYIADEYESGSGNRYYKGIRFCENLAIVEKVGNYHCWTYIDGIEIYSFDGKERRLIGSRKFDKVFYNADFIRNNTKEMVEEYVVGQMKLRDIQADIQQIKQYSDDLVERSYTSLLNDDYLPRLNQMLPILSPSHQLAQ